ncbi:MAG: hypothetical protein Q9217_002504 [Psora testacea]
MSQPPRDHGDTTQSARIPPVATPHWGAQTGSAFTICATTTTIHASAESVLDTLLDTARYPEWNNFVPRVTIDATTTRPDNEPATATAGRLRENTTFTEHIDMFGHGKPSGLVRMRLLMTTLRGLEDNRKGFRVVWLGKGYPDWALRSERVHEIFEGESEGEVVYDVFETFSGPLAVLVKVFVGRALVKRFGQWNRELKGFVEKRDGGIGSGFVGI